MLGLTILFASCKYVFPYGFGYSDELGFIHPSQFSLLNKESGISANLSGEAIHDSAGRIASSQECSKQENLYFWNRDHKLGISTHVLLPLYRAAKHAFMTTFKQYKMRGNKSDEVGVCFPASSSCDNLESILLRHSRSLLLLSCDFMTAWNCRLSSYPLIVLYFINIWKSTSWGGEPDKLFSAVLTIIDLFDCIFLHPSVQMTLYLVIKLLTLSHIVCHFCDWNVPPK